MTEPLWTVLWYDKNTGQQRLCDTGTEDGNPVSYLVFNTWAGANAWARSFNKDGERNNWASRYTPIQLPSGYHVAKDTTIQD